MNIVELMNKCAEVLSQLMDDVVILVHDPMLGWISSNTENITEEQIIACADILGFKGYDSESEEPHAEPKRYCCANG